MPILFHKLSYTFLTKIFFAFLFILSVPFSVFAAPITSGNTDAVFTDTSYGSLRLVIPGSAAANANAQPVDVSASGITGQAFGDHIGWVQFDGQSHGVDVSCNSGVGTLSGLAWGQTSGWINFGPFNNNNANQVTIDSGGNFSGLAWAHNAGWLDFSGVETAFHCSTTTTGGGDPDPSASCSLSFVPSVILPGQSATLIWHTNIATANITSGSIMPAPGIVTTENGSVVVSPGLTTAYNATFTGTGVDNSPANCSATLTVVSPNQPSVRFDPTSYSVQEGATAALKIKRIGSASGSVSAVVATQNASATAPADYTATFQTVTWASGDTSTKTVNVNTVSDTLNEGSEQFTASITQAIGASIDAQADTAFVTINDEGINNVVTSIVLRKEVLNAYGHTAGPNDFTLTLNGQPVLQNSAIAIVPGQTYTLGESSVPSYQFDAITGSASCPNNINEPFILSAGQNAVCVIHNRDICVGPLCPLQNVCLNPNAQNYNQPGTCIIKPSECVGDQCPTDNPNTPTGEALTAVGALGAFLGALVMLAGLLGGIGSFAELLARLLNILFGLFVPLRRKPWGLVYDSVTKEPLDPVIVTVFDVYGNEVAQTTSDMYGRYGFLMKPGTYTMTAAKTHYAFPSKVVHGSTDSGYESLYYGGQFTIEQNAKALLFNIPMDPLERDWNQDEKRRMHIFRRQRILFAIDKITRFFFPIGFVASFIALIMYPAWFNILIFGLYILNLLFLIKGVQPKSYGSIISSNGNTISAARVSLYNVQTKTLISRRVTNEFGQYYMLVQPGIYFATVELLQQDGSYTVVHTTEPMHLRRGIFSKTIKL